MKPRTRRTSSGFRVTDQPAISAVAGRRPRSVASIRSVVVLPAPFGPTSPKISPSSMSRSTPATASVPVVALDEALGPDDGAHSIVPVDRDVDLEPDAVGAVVDEPDQDAARRRVDVARRVRDRVAGRRRRGAAGGRQACGVEVEQLDLGQRRRQAAARTIRPTASQAGGIDRQRLDRLPGRRPAPGSPKFSPMVSLVGVIRPVERRSAGRPAVRCPGRSSMSIGSFVKNCASDATTVERSRSAWNVVVPVDRRARPARSTGRCRSDAASGPRPRREDRTSGPRPG